MSGKSCIRGVDYSDVTRCVGDVQLNEEVTSLSCIVTLQSGHGVTDTTDDVVVRAVGKVRRGKAQNRCHEPLFVSCWIRVKKF